MRREIRIFQSVFKEWNPSSSLPSIEIRFYRYTSLSHTIRLRDGAIKVRLSHLFQGAPGPVIRAVARILFSKLYQHRVPRAALQRYHQFVEKNQARFRQLLSQPSLFDRPHSQSRGHHQDLEKIFSRLNQRYFRPPLSKPTLRWSLRGTETKLGEYQSLRHAIVINRRFDRASVPPYVLEYLMFHEMLHMKHAAEIRQGRRRVHTRDFRKEEKAFEHYERARNWIQKLTRRPDWRRQSREF